MLRGWTRILLAWVVLGGLAGAAPAQTGAQPGVQPGAFVGPPAPPPLASAELAASEAPVPESPAKDTAVPPQEAQPLGGVAGDAAKFRGSFARAGAETPPGAPTAAPSLRAGDGWWRTAGALALVIGLIIAVGIGAKGLARRSGGLLHALGPGGRAPSGLLQVLGRYPVGRGQMLVLIKLDRRVLLVSQAAGPKGGGMQTLCELTDPEEVASILMLTAEAEGRSIAARFREMVSGFESSHEAAEQALAPIHVASALPGPTPEPLPEALPGPLPESMHGDPLGSLQSRLDSLRRVGGRPLA